MGDTSSKPILPDANMPPAILLSQAAGYVKNYLAEHGATRGAFDIKDTDSRPLATPTVPTWMHLALSQLINHSALPYAGTMAAFIRDAIYLTMYSYAALLHEIGESGEDTKLVDHVVRREEAFRRDQYIEESGVAQVMNIIAAGKRLELARLAGDKKHLFDQLGGLFLHLNGMDEGIWRHQMIVLMRGTPEIQEAITFLQQDFGYMVKPEVAGWASQLEDTSG